MYQLEEQFLTEMTRGINHDTCITEERVREKAIRKGLGNAGVHGIEAHEVILGYRSLSGSFFFGFFRANGVRF